MPQSTTLQRRIDLKRTEGYLLSLAGVRDASVWLTDGELHAYVEVDDGALSEGQIRRQCREDLGPQYTPTMMTLASNRPMAA